MEQDVKDALFTLKLHHPDVITRIRKLVIDDVLARDCDARGMTEHAKLYRLHDENDVCGDFCEWLKDKGFRQSFLDDDGTTYPVYSATEELLGEYFEIDHRALNDEKEAMLDEIRSTTAARTR